MKLVIVWIMNYNNGSFQTEEFYNQFSKTSEPLPFEEDYQNASLFYSFENVSREFRKLVLKYPEMHLEIKEM